MPSVEVSLSLFTVAVSLAGSWLIARWTIRAERASSAQSDAVNMLFPSIAQLRALLHESCVRRLNPEDVSVAMAGFESLCLQHGAALPAGLRTLRFDVRAAVGNYFGGVSLAYLDARMATYPLSQPDPYWQDISVSYMDHVTACLQRSLVQPKVTSITPFSEWRRHEDDSQRRSCVPQAFPGATRT